MSYEITKEDLKYEENNPINSLIWNYRDSKKLDKFKDKIKTNKFYQVDLEGKTRGKVDIRKLSGILENNEINEFVEKLIPYSFIIQAKIELTFPYYSSDDNNFYLIQNPCLKEKVFKVPMVRGSGWKGAIARAGKELINEDKNLSLFASYVRIFGTGSDEYRKLFDKITKDKDFKENLIRYLLFELGKKLTKKDIDKINSDPEEYLKEELETNRDDFKNISYLQPHKGRAIFYPTHFDRLSLEIINPHSRKTRAGTNPIHYEVVPKGTKGILQIVYVPFDAVLEKDEEIKNQVEEDIKFLTNCVEKVSEIGIGAKEKLGWGIFKIASKKAKCNKKVEIPEGWKNE